MKSILTVITFVGSLISAPSSFAQSDEAMHLQSARDHVNAAIAEGQQGDSKALVEHAEEGLQHAKQAEKIKSLPDVNKSIEALNESIRLGKSGDANKGTDRAKEAVNYMDAALGALGG